MDKSPWGHKSIHPGAFVLVVKFIKGLFSTLTFFDPGGYVLRGFCLPCHFLTQGLLSSGAFVHLVTFWPRGFCPQGLLSTLSLFDPGGSVLRGFCLPCHFLTQGVLSSGAFVLHLTVLGVCGWSDCTWCVWFQMSGMRKRTRCRTSSSTRATTSSFSWEMSCTHSLYHADLKHSCLKGLLNSDPWFICPLRNMKF